MSESQPENVIPGTEYLYAFLRHLGVQGSVQLDSRSQPMIVMANEQFEQHRKPVLTWFSLLSQRDGYTYLCERQRGTGETLAL